MLHESNADRRRAASLALEVRYSINAYMRCCLEVQTPRPHRISHLTLTSTQNEHLERKLTLANDERDELRALVTDERRFNSSRNNKAIHTAASPVSCPATTLVADEAHAQRLKRVRRTRLLCLNR